MFKKISVITPVYNERDNLPVLIDSLEKVLSSHACEFEIIIVDDYSPDGSGEIAEKLAELYLNIKVIHRPSKMGLGTAIKDGFKHASGDFIVSIDCDLSHDTADLPALIGASKEYDIVIGSRFVEGGEIKGRSMGRNLLSMFANWFIKHLTGYQIKDWTSGFRIYRRGVLEAIFPKVACKKWDFQFEVLYKSLKSSFLVKEMPIKFRERKRGTSKFNMDEALIFVKSVFKIYFSS